VRFHASGDSLLSSDGSTLHLWHAPVVGRDRRRPEGPGQRQLGAAVPIGNLVDPAESAKVAEEVLEWESTFADPEESAAGLRRLLPNTVSPLNGEPVETRGGSEAEPRRASGQCLRGVRRCFRSLVGSSSRWSATCDR
jgi:hypothetical protein